MSKKEWNKVVKLAEQYGYVRDSQNCLIKVGDADEQRFKGVSPNAHATLAKTLDGWLLERTHVDGTTETFVGEDAEDGLEYFLDSGSLQDDGFEPVDEEENKHA